MTYKEQRDKEILRLYQTGNYSYDKLAKKYGISKTTVCHICKPEIKERHRALMKSGKISNPRPSKKRKFNYTELATNLIEAMSDYALAVNWDDDTLIKKLLDCGIARRDFVAAGYGEFVREYFDGEVV